MSLDAKRKRLSELSKIPRFAALDHRYFLNDAGEDERLASLSRSERRKLAKGSRQLKAEYLKTMQRIQRTGAGFPIDRLLHQLAIEYTSRYAVSGIYNQPLSFNYFEAFCDIKLLPNTVAPYAEPVQEIDHLFNIVDFFDYATSSESSGFVLSQLNALPDGRALHFTTNGDVNDFTFLTSEGREFVISGFSMVRRENFLHWYIVGGAIFSEDEWTELSATKEQMEVKAIPPWKRPFLDQVAAEKGNQPGGPVPLEGTKTTQRTVIAGELDLNTEKHLGRCYMTETENKFEIVCDDPDILDHISDMKEREALFGQLKQRIDQTAVMWSLGETMFQLPAYFAFKVNVAKRIVVSAGHRAPPKTRKGGRGLDVYFKTVSTIDFVDDAETPIRAFTPTHYRIETGGFWRRLSTDAYGKGPNGDPVKGKTWVKAKNDWRDEGNTTRTIFVKSTVAAARLQAADYIQRAGTIVNTIENENSNKNERGVLYVLRCTVMSEEVYKVGWTSGTAEERAKELSSATGVPSSFVVVDQWRHPDPAALEKNVHAMLDPYRLNDRREFFRLEYGSLKRVIEREIDRNKNQ